MANRFSRPTLGDHFSEGARLLWTHLLSSGLSQKALSEELGLGAGGGQVSLWLYGRRRPGLAPALNIEARIGIPARAWTEAPSEPFELPGGDAPAAPASGHDTAEPSTGTEG